MLLYQIHWAKAVKLEIKAKSIASGAAAAAATPPQPNTSFTSNNPNVSANIVANAAAAAAAPAAPKKAPKKGCCGKKPKKATSVQPFGAAAPVPNHLSKHVGTLIQDERGEERASCWTFIVPPKTQLSLPYSTFFKDTRFGKNLTMSIFSWSNDDEGKVDKNDPKTFQSIAGKPFKPFLIHGNLPIPPEFCKLQVDVIRTATKYKVNAIDNVFSDVGVGLQFFGKPHGFAGNAKWLQETKLTTNMRIRTDEDKLKSHSAIKKKAKDKAQLEYEDIMPKVQEPATPATPKNLN